MSKRLNRVVSDAFQRLNPRRRRDREQLEEGKTEGSNAPQSAALLPTAASSTGPPAPAAPDSSLPAIAPAALPVVAESAEMAPAAPPAPAGGTPPLTEDSLRAMLAESTEASLSVAPPLHGDVHTQRRLETAVGFDDVLAAVQPLPDALSALPERVADLECQLRFAQSEAAAAVRSVAPEIVPRENAEAFLKAANAEIEALHHNVKILRESNAKNDAMLATVQATMERHAEDLNRLHCEVQTRDVFISTLHKKLAREREVYKSSIGANTEQTRKLHLLLVKLAQGKYVDNDKLKVLENKQGRNTRLLHANRTLRAHVSLAGMDPEVLRLAVDGLTAGELDLDALDLDQETSVALRRIQSATASSDDPQALPAALAKAAHQVTHGKSHKRLRPGGEDSDDEPDDSDEDKAPIPTDKASTSMAAAGLGDAPPADTSTPKSARRSLFGPKAWKKAAQKKRKKSCPHSPATSPRRHMKTRSKSSDVDMGNADPSSPSGKEVDPGNHNDVPDSPDAPSPPPQGPPDVAKPLASTISPSSADIRAAEEAVREAEQMRLMFGSSDEGEESDHTVPQGKSASASVATSKTVEVSGVVSTAGSAPVEAAPLASVSSKPAPIVPTVVVPSVSSPDFSMEIDDDGNADDDRGDDVDDNDPSVDDYPDAPSGGSDVPPPTDHSSTLYDEDIEDSDGNWSNLGPARPPTPPRPNPSPMITSPIIVGGPPPSPPANHPAPASSPPVPVSPRPPIWTLDAGPGRMITATYTSVPRRGGAPSVEPLPHRVLSGVRPTVPASSTLPPWVLPYVDMEFTDAGAKKCFERLLSLTLPEPVGEVTVRTTLEGLQAFFDYSHPDHPYQQLRQLYPLQACLFDTVGFNPSVPISKRAPIETRLEMVWANLRGDGGRQGDLGFALWERLHCLPLAGIERGLAEEAKKVGHDKERLKELRVLLKKFFSERDRRADRLRSKYREQYMAWSRDSVSSGTSGAPFIRPELLLEPSKPWYPIENLSFAPRTSDWLSEAPALDARQPWRTGWMNAPHQHPYNTTYFPCQRNPEIFNPHGTRFVNVYRSVIVNPSLGSTEVIPTWRSLFDSPPGTLRPALAAAPVEAGTDDSQGPAAAPAAEAQVPDEGEKESGDSTSLALLATAARQLESI
ncbi:hypothetical protein PInf_025108 [Phytophthora infestans]|nr:hypothetical protein PInf_025108 [Phytophthora infestans]